MIDRSLACAAFTSLLFACGSPSTPAAPTNDGAPTSTTTPSSTSTSTAPAATGGPAAADGAKEGEMCGDGVMGRPKIACATGLVCDLKGTAPSAPPGAQGSALPGKCKKP